MISLALTRLKRRVVPVTAVLGLCIALLSCSGGIGPGLLGKSTSPHSRRAAIRGDQTNLPSFLRQESGKPELRLTRDDAQKLNNEGIRHVKSSGRPRSRRHQMLGLAGVALTGIAAAQKVSAEEGAAAGAEIPIPKSKAVPPIERQGSMPSVSVLRRAELSLRNVQKALRNNKMERESYTRGAPAALIATGAHSLAGFSAGALSTIVLHPIDTIKTRLQKGAPNITEAIKEGSLYNGIISNLLKEAPNSAIYMTVVEAIEKILLTGIPNAPLLALFLAGGFGDLVGSICRVPAEMLNKRLQTGMSPDIGDACEKTFFTPEGRQLTKETWGVVVMRDVPHGAFQYMVFLGAHTPALALLTALPFVPDSSMQFLSDFVPGALAGAIAGYVTTPADVMVTNFATYQEASAGVQKVGEKASPDQFTDFGEESRAADRGASDGQGFEGETAVLALPQTKADLETADTALAGERPSFQKIGKEIYEREGLQGFFVGGIQRALYYAPMTGVFFGLYESLDRTLYPMLLPALTSPVLYNFKPVIAELVEGLERGAIQNTLILIKFLEHLAHH